jgi:hypothetical protein
VEPSAAFTSFDSIGGDLRHAVSRNFVAFLRQHDAGVGVQDRGSLILSATVSAAMPSSVMVGGGGGSGAISTGGAATTPVVGRVGSRRSLKRNGLRDGSA